MKNIIQVIKNNSLLIILALLGAGAGYGYWFFVGCLSGSCSITSVWYNSALYGLVLGGLLGSIMKDMFSKSSQ